MRSLKENARAAVIWNAGFNIFRDALQFGVMLVLVRLLAPEAYGEFGFVMSLIGFMAVFAFNNFVAYTVQVKHDEEINYQDHFTAGAFFQISLFVMTNCVALGLSMSSRYKEVSPFLHVMSLLFLLEWPCDFRRRMLEREFDWRRLRVLHAIGLILNAIGGITLALLGWGTYALLIPALMVPLPFIFDLVVREKWRPTWAFSWKRYQPAWLFGLARIGSAIALNIRQLLESASISAVLGFASLGILNRSLGLAQLFCYKIGVQLLYSIYPLLTRASEDSANCQRIGALVLRAVAWTVFPTAMCVGMLAHPIVHTVYGKTWSSVASLLPWAMAWGALAATAHASYMLLLSRHRQNLCLIADMINLIATATVLWAVMPHGTIQYLIALVCIQGIIVTLLVFWLFSCKVIRSCGVRDALLPSITGAIVAASGATLLFELGFSKRPNNFVTASIWGGVFFALYLTWLRAGFASQLSALIQYCPASRHVERFFFLADRR